MTSTTSLRTLVRRPFMRWILLVLAAALVPGCAWLDVKQKELIWRPSTAWWASFDVQANGVEEVWIPRAGAKAVNPALAAISFFAPPEAAALSGDAAVPIAGNGERLHAWWWRHENPDAPAMLYLHGARWNLEGNAFRIARLRKLGFSVLAIDYRGFGKTGGDLPDEDDTYADAEAAWAYLKTLAPAGARRFVYGHSLGGAVAIELAGRVADLDGLVVESTFTSIRDMAGTYSVLRFLPVGLFITQRYDSLSRVDRVRAPKLFVHGASDRFVPPEMSKSLFERAAEPKRLLLIEGANHSNSTGIGFEQYRATFAEFFRIGGEGVN